MQCNASRVAPLSSWRFACDFEVGANGEELDTTRKIVVHLRDELESIKRNKLSSEKHFQGSFDKHNMINAPSNNLKLTCDFEINGALCRIAFGVLCSACVHAGVVSIRLGESYRIAQHGVLSINKLFSALFLH